MPDNHLRAVKKCMWERAGRDRKGQDVKKVMMSLATAILNNQKITDS
jgi:hypothetical protein